MHLTTHLASADLFISGTGMAAAHLAYLFQMPFIAINTDQPEQKSNLERLKTLSQTYVLNWNDSPHAIHNTIQTVCQQLTKTTVQPKNLVATQHTIEAELALWVDTISSYI